MSSRRRPDRTYRTDRLDRLDWARRADRLDPATAARARRAAACPDCSASVTVDRRRGILDIRHDTGCPALAALRRQGRDRAVAVIPTTGSIGEAVRAIRQQHPDAHARNGFYDDVHRPPR